MRPRATFGPVVLLGLGSSALAAVAASKPMVRVDPDDLEAAGMASLSGRLDDLVSRDLPLPGALSLLLLAGWGVLLVTRGRVRRGFAVVAALLALGVLASTVLGGRALLDDYPDELVRELGGAVHLGSELRADPTGWLWALAAASVLALLAGLAAVRWAPQWPEMGSRYDAPTGATAPGTAPGPPAEQSNLDLWKQLDEGHDPTSGPA